MYRLIYDKETERFCRYSEKIDEVKFTIYIEKWRMPSPTPSIILVEIGSPKDFKNKRKYNQEDVSINPELKKNPIYEECREIEEKTQTIRHDPIVKRNDWELGSVYIPKDLVPPSEIVSIVVEWQ